MNEGTESDSVSNMFVVAWDWRSVPLNTSIGADDSCTVRSTRRVPVTMTSETSFGGASSPAATERGACWAATG